MDDGSVEVVACGEAQQVEKLIAWLKAGGPRSYDLLTVTKGPETVLWGPGNSAGTVRFEREPPRFDKAGIKGDASFLAASNDRFDENADVSFGNDKGYVRLTGNNSKSGDYKDGNGDRVASKWDKWNTDVAVGWTPDADTLLELTAGQGNGDASYARCQVMYA
jgi:iron complex outermembrane receptor protein